LPNKRSDAVWRFFTRDMLGVVDHTDGLTQRAQAQANLGILGEAVLVPATNACKQIPPDKHRVAAQGNHADPGMKVQPALKPEEVLKAVVAGKPMVTEVHQLHAGLDHAGL